MRRAANAEPRFHPVPASQGLRVAPRCEAPWQNLARWRSGPRTAQLRGADQVSRPGSRRPLAACGSSEAVTGR